MRAVARLRARCCPLGASRRRGAKGRAWLVGVFLGALRRQRGRLDPRRAAGRFQPFPLETVGDRAGARAPSPATSATSPSRSRSRAWRAPRRSLLDGARGRRARPLAGAALALFAAGLVVNRNLTALTAPWPAPRVLLVVALPDGARCSRSPAPLLLPALARRGATRPLRHRASRIAARRRAGRLGRAARPIAAGPGPPPLEMARERPLTGFGPGTFGAEYVPHRLAAEIRARRRFVEPARHELLRARRTATTSRSFADAGVPRALAALGAVGVPPRGASAARRWRGAAAPRPSSCSRCSPPGPSAALTWFPLQRPITAVPLLLAAGRAWRISATARSRPPEDAA